VGTKKKSLEKWRKKGKKDSPPRKKKKRKTYVGTVKLSMMHKKPLHQEEEQSSKSRDDFTRGGEGKELNQTGRKKTGARQFHRGSKGMFEARGRALKTEAGVRNEPEPGGFAVPKGSTAISGKS